MESLDASFDDVKKSAIRQKFFLFSMNKNKKATYVCSDIIFINSK